jgi:hypothetical protein
MPLAGSKPGKVTIAKGTPILWRDPGTGLNLYYGPGSPDREPRGPFTFIKEDTGGSSPKYTVSDAAGVKWKIKLGLESRAETAATRLVWAAGFFANEDYLVPELRVEGLPAHLKRHKLIEAGGVMRNARLKRESPDEEKAGEWKWRDNPFRGTREWYGLRAVMALLNNWDVKDENNAIYHRGDALIYMVSDIGATFGAPGRSWPASRSKDNLKIFLASRFICAEHDTTVDFCSPGRASIAHLVDPLEFHRRLKLRWVGRDIPRADAKWIGTVLSRLSPTQIRDAFRAAGYSPAEIEGFTEAVEHRIVDLTDL